MKGTYYWIPAGVKHNVTLTSEGKCHWCSKKATRAEVNKRGQMCLYDENGNIFHFDHKTLVSMGGASDETNLVLSCRNCNLSKRKKKIENDKTSIEFMAKINK